MYVLYLTGPGASVFSGSIDKAAHTADCNGRPDAVKGVVVVSVYEPSCISLAQGITVALVATAGG